MMHEPVQKMQTINLRRTGAFAHRSLFHETAFSLRGEEEHILRIGTFSTLAAPHKMVVVEGGERKIAAFLSAGAYMAKWKMLLSLSNFVDIEFANIAGVGMAAQVDAEEILMLYRDSVYLGAFFDDANRNRKQIADIIGKIDGIVTLIRDESQLSLPELGKVAYELTKNMLEIREKLYGAVMTYVNKFLAPEEKAAMDAILPLDCFGKPIKAGAQVQLVAQWDAS